MDTCISLKKVGESQNVKCMKLLFDFSCKSPVALKHMEYKWKKEYIERDRDGEVEKNDSI